MKQKKDKLLGCDFTQGAVKAIRELPPERGCRVAGGVVAIAFGTGQETGLPKEDFEMAQTIAEECAAAQDRSHEWGMTPEQRIEQRTKSRREAARERDRLLVAFKGPRPKVESYEDLAAVEDPLAAAAALLQVEEADERGQVRLVRILQRMGEARFRDGLSSVLGKLKTGEKIENRLGFFFSLYDSTKNNQDLKDRV